MLCYKIFNFELDTFEGITRLLFYAGDDKWRLTCPGGGLFMVLRALWILGGAEEGAEEAVAEEEDEEEEEEGPGAGTDLLLPGPETLIFARPGDNTEDVDGEDVDGEDIDGRDFAACPVRGRYR